MQNKKQFEIEDQVVVTDETLMRCGRVGTVQSVGARGLVCVRWNDLTMRSTYKPAQLTHLTEWLNAGNSMH